MPTQTYEITAPNGKVLEITGTRVPTETELHEIFAKAGVETGSKPIASVPAVKPASTNPFDPQNPAVQDLQRRDREKTTAGRTLMPAIGGAVGGVLGGMPGAALGGAAGEAFKQLDQRMSGDVAPGTPLGAAKDIAASGAIQGAAEGAGQLLTGAAGKASTWLMNRAVNATDRLSREFPDMSKTLIEHAITVSQGGLNKARRLLSVAKGEANAALTTAQAQGVTVPITGATQGLTRTMDAVMNSSDPVGGLAALAKAERNITSGRPADLTPTAADALKRSLQAQSKQLYLAGKMGNGHPGLVVQAQAKADMAAALNNAIEQATSAVGATGYKAANHSAQELIGAVRGVTKGVRPGANLYQAMVRPGVGVMLGAGAGETKGHPVAGALAGAAMTSPLGMSLAAIGLHSPAMLAVVRQLPRAVSAALIDYLTTAAPAAQTADSPSTP